MITWRLHASCALSLLASALLVAASPAAVGERASDARTATRIVDLNYEFVVRSIPPKATSVFAWIPIPPTDPHQRLLDYEVSDEYPHRTLTESEYGNRFLRFDLSEAVRRRSDQATVRVHFRVVRLPIVSPAGDDGEVRDPEPSPRFLAADRLVPTDGEVALEARRIAGTSVGALQRARRLYDHIVATVHYDKSGQGWGRGDAVYACDVRHGNCTDFHSLFIGEARALGIPARFVMGLPLPEDGRAGTIPGYHCWAEFYVRGTGWLPIDASEASRHPEKRGLLFGALDANRIAFSVGRDIRLPQSSSGPVNYSIYPHVEVDGEEFSHVETTFAFQNETQVTGITRTMLNGYRAAVVSRKRQQSRSALKPQLSEAFGRRTRGIQCRPQEHP